MLRFASLPKGSMTRTLAIAALLSLLVRAPAQAADTVPAHAAPAAAAPAAAPVPIKAGAADLARLMVPKEAWSRSMGMLAQDTQQRLQSHPGSQLTFPADFGAKVRAEVEAVLPYDDLIKLHAQELSGAYTEQELAELLAFYRSPAGQKYLKVQPEVSARIEQATRKRMEQRMPEVLTRLSSGLKHPAPAAPAPAKPAGKPAGR
jgi:hypothetical protein